MSQSNSNKSMLAFLMVGGIMLAVAGRVAWVTGQREVAQPELKASTPGRLPEYSILDRAGRTIAHSVPRFDLEMSPRAMWQVHTPQRIARTLSAALGGQPSEQELLVSFFPSAVDGVIQAQGLSLNARSANRVGRWLAGEAGEEQRPAIQGMWLRELQAGRSWTVAWRPLELLAEEQRKLQGHTSAWGWARGLANGLAKCLLAPGQELPVSDAEATEVRDQIWKMLIPRAATRVVQGIPSEHVMALRAALKEEHVGAVHMQVSFDRDREYPADNQELFGDWGFVTEEDKEARPRAGLELLCDGLVRSQEWQARLASTNSKYSYRRDRTVLGERANTYLDYEEASQEPFLESTLDLHLQSFLKQELDKVMLEHRPAMVMGIVLDVNSGDVLAVDSSEAYGVEPFAPIYYTYTIGSTFKILTMASALEESLVRPGERLSVGAGAFPVRYTRGPKAGRMSRRVIREAEGAKQGIIEARDAFAFSVNAGLAQVGLRMEDEVFHGYLKRLGYGQVPGSGLGIEHAGHLADLPWSFAYTHASISFGHEITSTVWQHAAAINTVLRGGVPVRLRMLRAVGQGDERYELSPEEGERVYSPSTCEDVHGMMRHGAEIGTGRHAQKALYALAMDALPLDQRTGISGADLIDMGTKTGTAEKVPTELCVHVEKEERRRLAEAGEPMTMEHYRSLKSRAKDHRSCYTSSIVIYAKLAQSERELMTYIVVEEPRGSERFGSKVAGPAAVSVMAEALGLTIGAQAPRRAVAEGVYSSQLAARNPSAEPWLPGEGASW